MLKKQETDFNISQLILFRCKSSHHVRRLARWRKGERLSRSFKGAWLSGWRLAPGNQRFSVRVRLLAVCRGELSAAIAQPQSNCMSSVWKWLRRVKEIASTFPGFSVILNDRERKPKQIKKLIPKRRYSGLSFVKFQLAFQQLSQWNKFHFKTKLPQI